MNLRFSHTLDPTKPAQQTHLGLTFYQASVFAIEQFKDHRRQSGEYKFDKYYLFKTPDIIQQNHHLQMQQSLGNSANSPPLQPLDNFILSSCEHPIKHFMNQLFNTNNTRDIVGNITYTLKEIMRIVNSNRFSYGSDNRIYGIQTTRIEPTHVILFTANPKLKNLQELLKPQNQRYQLFDETFQWDQKLHVINYREKKDLSSLKQLIEITGGTYQNINEFNQVKLRMKYLAENCLFSIQCKLRFQNASKSLSTHNNSSIEQEYSYIKLYFDIGQKIKNQNFKGKIQISSSNDMTHRMNLEDIDQRQISKDRWPIPIFSSSFMTQNSQGIYFSSTYPGFIIEEKPIKIELSKTCAEVLHFNDPARVMQLTHKLIDPFKYTDNDIQSIGWLIYCEGETRQYPFALLKAMQNISKRQIDQLKTEDYTMMNVPYFFSIHVMPLNYQEFWPLVSTINEFRGQQQGYEKTKWKLAFQKYIEKIPPYYNDYLNSYLKYLKADELLLTPTDKIYFTNNQYLANAVRDLKFSIGQQEAHHEQAFQKYKREHQIPKQNYSCCQNLQVNKQKSIEKKAEQYFGYNLMNDRDLLIPQTLWLFSQVSLETFDPIYIGQNQQQILHKKQQALKKQAISQQQQSKSQDQDKNHQVQIYFMSDYEAVLRKREKIRYPDLTDEQNIELHKVYFGNPFKWNLNKQNLSQNEMTYDERTFEGVGGIINPSKDDIVIKNESPPTQGKVITRDNEQMKSKEQCYDNQKVEKKMIQINQNLIDQKSKTNKQVKLKSQQDMAEKDLDSQKKQEQRYLNEKKFKPDINKAELLIRDIRQQNNNGQIQNISTKMINIQLKRTKESDIQCTQGMQIHQYLQVNPLIKDKLMVQLLKIVEDPYNESNPEALKTLIAQIDDNLDRDCTAIILSEITYFLQAFGYNQMMDQLNSFKDQVDVTKILQEFEQINKTSKNTL
ncbi:UNKNOWN [Stylonychia lemnae]|uniref:Uncharacterized protein n=1 Tax=Stylonychia lemnae TaxID=5949 RepID=A0A078BF36_STYLE|nr:UNKNOWN [Stylonychia lemnae]|eukprot:CDW91762.1 UNKNOWN [Stylonychia lemnae]